MSQPLFKSRKPQSLSLEFLDPVQQKAPTPASQQELPLVPEIDTFEEFCSNIPAQEYSKQSFEQQSQQSSRSEYKAWRSDQQDASNIQYIVFEEFHPQSTVQSESVRNSEKHDSPKVQEPPAPSNKKNQMKFCFPANAKSGLRKQLQIVIPEVEHNSTSSYEQTMIKQQQQLAVVKQGDEDYKAQLIKLQAEFDQQKAQFKLQLNEAQQKKHSLEKKLEAEEQNVIRLQIENERLNQKIQSEQDKSECLSQSMPHGLKDQDKISYLIDKLHKKSNQNAKLQYEILKLQNHIEILQTKHLMQSQTQHISDSEHISDNQSPPQQSVRLSNQHKQSLVSNQKNNILNLSAYQTQLEQKKIINLSHLVSPLARTSKLAYPKNLTTHHQNKNNQYKEDTLQNLKKIQSTKNSTSVGDLNSFKHDLTNCSNILQKIMRKDSHSTQSPDKTLYAAQKFRETLNAKLQNVPEKHKSYASLLFSLGDFSKPKTDAYIRQHSPHEEQRLQKYRSGNQGLPNSRKQSETLKSEESHKMSADLKMDSMMNQRKGNQINY
ncbi:hypothetical protein pb186bvf_014155 [Paramecium bursaria]